jgi:hypothetical protein
LPQFHPRAADRVVAIALQEVGSRHATKTAVFHNIELAEETFLHAVEEAAQRSTDFCRGEIGVDEHGGMVPFTGQVGVAHVAILVEEELQRRAVSVRPNRYAARAATRNNFAGPSMHAGEFEYLREELADEFTAVKTSSKTEWYAHKFLTPLLRPRSSVDVVGGTRFPHISG